MSANSTEKSRRRIADKLFYGITILLVVVLGVLGSVIVQQRVLDVSRRVEKRVDTTANYMEQVLPPAVYRLDAQLIRQSIEGIASDDLQAVEILDAAGERIYVYERKGAGGVVYDKKVERDLVFGGNSVGKVVAYFSVGKTLSSVRTREMLQLVVLITAAGLVLAAGLYFFVRKIVVKPIESILAFSEGLANGKFDKRLDATSNDEMGLLQESLNRMANALEEAIDGLKASFYEAEAAHRRETEASRLKSEFLASMSHEIRTPVNAIMGFADLLMDDEKVEDRRESLRTIKNSANILLENINDILDLSKLEAGRVELAEIVFSLQELVSEITPIVKLRLHGKDVVFSSRIADELKHPLRGDRVRLRQVLLNILVNATKFTYRGRIELDVSRAADGRRVMFKIFDTGIGIAKEFHARIFEPFTQVENSASREHGGVGLGLAIAKRLVDMMNGKIRIESEVGKGATFYVEVPLEDAG